MTRARIEVRADEPELGEQRYCPGCDSWWPHVPEFWWRFGTRQEVCSGCQSERGQRVHARKVASP